MSGSMNTRVDFGDGREIDVELDDESQQLWVAAGSGVAGADLWLKAQGKMIDLRIRALRTDRGIAITVDRGDDQTMWWNPQAAPRLLVMIDEAAGTATVFAGVGQHGEFQEVLLGQTGI